MKLPKFFPREINLNFFLWKSYHVRIRLITWKEAWLWQPN